MQQVATIYKLQVATIYKLQFASVLRFSGARRMDDTNYHTYAISSFWTDFEKWYSPPKTSFFFFLVFAFPIGFILSPCFLYILHSSARISWLLSEIPVRCVLSSCLDDPSSFPNFLVEAFCSSFASAPFTLISVQHLFLLLVLLLQPEPVTHKLPPMSYALTFAWENHMIDLLIKCIEWNGQQKYFSIPWYWDFAESLLKTETLCFYLLFAMWSSKVPERSSKVPNNDFYSKRQGSLSRLTSKHVS